MSAVPGPSHRWPLGDGRTLGEGQRTVVWVADLGAGRAEPIWDDSELLLEAPNWAPDGDALLLNGHGLLWRLELGPRPELHEVPLRGIPPINNDHVVDVGRGLLYLSANDGHIWVAPLAGGDATRVTHDTEQLHFLHGVSPDGTTLAYVALPVGDLTAAGQLALVPATGGRTSYPAAGSAHVDGPEYSPDGTWIYLNTEHFGRRPGHAQLARVPATGGGLEQLVSTETVDWFPHLSPDGEYATSISFPTGTLGHPADLDVEVRLVRTTDWNHPIARLPVPGGQGTLNVNSWAPDSRRFAFVSYPTQEQPAASTLLFRPVPEPQE